MPRKLRCSSQDKAHSKLEWEKIAGLSYTALRDAILAHPTLLEGLGPLFASTPSISKSADGNS
jgi:hypothetical protein